MTKLDLIFIVETLPGVSLVRLLLKETEMITLVDISDLVPIIPQKPKIVGIAGGVEIDLKDLLPFDDKIIEEVKLIVSFEPLNLSDEEVKRGITKFTVPFYVKNSKVKNTFKNLVPKRIKNFKSRRR